MGGLSKRAYIISQLEQKGLPTLLLDSGNILYKNSDTAKILEQDILAASAILEIYKKTGYDAMAVGPHDLANGISPLVESFLSGTPWVSANLFTTSDMPVFPPWVIRNTENSTIGIMGLTAKASLPEGFVLKSWQEVLPLYLEQLAESCDFIILLSNLDSKNNAEIALKFPQIHLIISADTKRGNVPPELVHDTLITQTHSRGQYLGILNVRWTDMNVWESGNKGKTPESGTFTFQFRSLPKHIKESEEINTIIDTLQKDIAAINKKSAARQTQERNNSDPLTANLASSKFAGPVSCKECHENQYKNWQQTSHATAIESLNTQQQQYNLRCLPCHVTHDVSDSTENQFEQYLLGLPDFRRMVGCESCHGPGRDHIDSEGQSPLPHRVNEATCTTCHTAEMDSNFNYTEKRKRIGCDQ